MASNKNTSPGGPGGGSGKTRTTNNLNTATTSNNNMTGNDKQKIDYQYEQEDQGPYRVMVELINTQNGKISINKLTLAYNLRKMNAYKGHIVDLKSIGRNKIMVYFNEYRVANRLTKDKDLQSKNYRAYIPRHLISVTGVIAGVPLDITEQEILEGIRCEYSVMQVYRMNRFIDDEKQPTQRMSVTFRASKLPDNVKIFCCSIRVRAFYRKAVLCLNCLRYNHKQENCKSKRRCHRCTRTHEDDEQYENCQQQKRCLHCRKQHETTDQACPERTRQNNVQAILARTNLTTIEVYEQFPIQTTNYYAALVETAQDPTPAESFAEVTAGSYKPCLNNPRRKRVGDNQISQSSSTNIAEQVVLFKEKKQKVTTEEQQNGTALFNKYKTTEAERWRTAMRQAQREQQMPQDKPTPTSSQQMTENEPETMESEEFSTFVAEMIRKGMVNGKSLEITELNT